MATTTNGNNTPSIRVGGKKEVLKIEVNDNGDYIELNFGDRTFLHRYFKLGETMERISKESRKDQLKLDENGSLDFSASAELIENDIKYHKELADGINDLFGAGTCKKVFDTETPSVDLIAEFFIALTPYVQSEVEKRKKTATAKYNAARRGGRR